METETNSQDLAATYAPPVKPEGAYRVVLSLNSPQRRIDQVLLEELRKQKDNLALANITRTEFKELFNKRKIRIKGQPARASSSLAKGTTYVDILK
jgi:hypothetical protein